MKHEGLGKRKKDTVFSKRTLFNKKTKERANEESTHNESEHQEGTSKGY